VTTELYLTLGFHHDPGSVCTPCPGHGEDRALGRPSGREFGVTTNHDEIIVNPICYLNDINDLKRKGI
jgi:hypothetical protein